MERFENRTKLFRSEDQKKRKTAVILGVAIPIKSQGKDHSDVFLWRGTGASSEMSEA